ncbi:MAG: heme o synthase [Xanthomonadales bacterium]|nr:heme o synthase [Xanthomonadales bacterium]
MTATAEQYLEVCKPKVVALIVFTAIVGMLMAVPGVPPLATTLWATLGIGLAAASGAAVNHLIDRREDAIMARTRHRPLPSGHLSSRKVLIFATLLGVAGVGLLVAFVNLLTAVLTFVAMIGYAIIYTVFLKRATPQNIVIGGAAGAAPPLLGWAAIQGQLDPPAYLLFLIIFAWTPPHFWALAIYRRHDYAAVNIPMLPVTHGVSFTRWHILFYTLILFLITLLPYLIGMSGLFYLGGAVVLGVVFLVYSARLLGSDEEWLAMRVFSYSIIYLIVLFAFLLVDHYLPLPHPLHDTAPALLDFAAEPRSWARDIQGSLP